MALSPRQPMRWSIRCQACRQLPEEEHALVRHRPSDAELGETSVADLETQGGISRGQGDRRTMGCAGRLRHAMSMILAEWRSVEGRALLVTSFVSELVEPLQGSVTPRLLDLF